MGMFLQREERVPLASPASHTAGKEPMTMGSRLARFSSFHSLRHQCGQPFYVNLAIHSCDTF